MFGKWLRFPSAPASSAARAAWRPRPARAEARAPSGGGSSAAWSPPVIFPGAQDADFVLVVLFSFSGDGKVTLAQMCR